MFGGFGTRDGTVDFYLRVSLALTPEMVVLDLGAGRGGMHDYIKGGKARLLSIKGKVRELIAADIDPAVFDNPGCDRAVLIENGRVPLADASVDLILCDYVLEHVGDPLAFVAEVRRVLKPGAWFCARTPHKWHYVAVASRLLSDRLEKLLLPRLQPGRKGEDVFPKVYKMNTLSALRDLFPGFEDQSFVYRSEPSYYFGSRVAFALMDFVHRVMPAPFSGSVMVFKRKLG